MRKPLYLKATVFSALLLLTIAACTSKNSPNKTAGQYFHDDSMIELAIDTNKTKAICDSNNKAMPGVPSLKKISLLAEQILSCKDSLYRNHYLRFTKDDSSMFSPLEKKLFIIIKEYINWFKLGKNIPVKMPVIIRNNHVPDKLSRKILPKINKSVYLSDKQFFFIGGGPYFDNCLREYDPFTTSYKNNVFKDNTGKPEKRYITNEQENNEYLINTILYKEQRIKIEIGEPVDCNLPSSEIVPLRSLNHILLEMLPVYFLTEHGAIPGRLVSVEHILFPCGRCFDMVRPHAYFASKTLINEEILGIFIPFQPINLAKYKATRKGNLWTADLDGDGIPEFAGVTTTWNEYEGALKMIWYINVNGEWKIIDQAKDRLCT